MSALSAKSLVKLTSLSLFFLKQEKNKETIYFVFLHPLIPISVSKEYIVFVYIITPPTPSYIYFSPLFYFNGKLEKAKVLILLYNLTGQTGNNMGEYYTYICQYNVIKLYTVNSTYLYTYKRSILEALVNSSPFPPQKKNLFIAYIYLSTSHSPLHLGHQYSFSLHLHNAVNMHKLTPEKKSKKSRKQIKTSVFPFNCSNTCIL